MPSPFLRSYPSVRGHRRTRLRSIADSRHASICSSVVARHLIAPHAHGRTLPEDAMTLLRDSSPLRPHLLFALSHGRSVEAASLVTGSKPPPNSPDFMSFSIEMSSFH